VLNRIYLIILIVLLTNSLLVAQETPDAVMFVGEKPGLNSDIYLWRPETGQLKALTETSAKEGNARWWPHKQLILASREISENHYGIVALNSELETVWLHEDPVGSLGWPVPSPWDNRILCVRLVGSGFVQPGFISYPDGDFEPFIWNGFPGGQLSWLAPDKIQLSRVKDGGFLLNHRNLVNGKETTIVSGGKNWQSFVDLKGNNFFSRRVGQVGSIFRLFKNTDGKWDYENFTNAGTYDWQPSVSPDGKTLIYKDECQGDFETVKNNIIAAVESGIHVELTNLVITGLNDSESEFRKMVDWVAGLNPDILLLLRLRKAPGIPDKFHIAHRALRG